MHINLYKTDIWLTEKYKDGIILFFHLWYRFTEITESDFAIYCVVEYIFSKKCQVLLIGK